MYVKYVEYTVKWGTRGSLAKEYDISPIGTFYDSELLLITNISWSSLNKFSLHRGHYLLCSMFAHLQICACVSVCVSVSTCVGVYACVCPIPPRFSFGVLFYKFFRQSNVLTMFGNFSSLVTWINPNGIFNSIQMVFVLFATQWLIAV